MELSRWKSKIVDLVEQGTPLQNEIQFQQNVICKDCRSGGGMGSSEFCISQPGRQPPQRAAMTHRCPLQITLHK